MRKMKKNSKIRATRSSYVRPLVFCGHFHKETQAEHDHFLMLKLGILLYDIVPSALSTECFPWVQVDRFSLPQTCGILVVIRYSPYNIHHA